MKLWADGGGGGAGSSVRASLKTIVSEQVDNINRKVLSRGTRAVNAIQDAEREVLQGARSGRVYKRPGTYGHTPSKATKKLLGEYGHKLRGGQLYRASAPGEAPARRTGNLRLHWNGDVKTEKISENSVSITVELESQEPYAYNLEVGKGMAPRPFVERIKKKAEQEIKKIYEEPYT